MGEGKAVGATGMAIEVMADEAVKPEFDVKRYMRWMWYSLCGTFGTHPSTRVATSALGPSACPGRDKMIFSECLEVGGFWRLSLPKHFCTHKQGTLVRSG